jgi:hypothetical protein
MQTIQDTNEQPRATSPQRGELIYRFEGTLGELCPIGVFPEGVRFHNDFTATVTDGPFAGGRMFGLDKFLLRPDGIGVIEAPEVIEHAGRRVAADVRGYVIPPDGAPVPPLDVIVSPDFAWPEVPFRVTGTALFRTADPDLDALNRIVAVIEGTVVMATGELRVEARRAS